MAGKPPSSLSACIPAASPFCTRLPASTSCRLVSMGLFGSMTRNFALSPGVRRNSRRVRLCRSHFDLQKTLMVDGCLVDFLVCFYFIKPILFPALLSLALSKSFDAPEYVVATLDCSVFRVHKGSNSVETTRLLSTQSDTISALAAHPGLSQFAVSGQSRRLRSSQDPMIYHTEFIDVLCNRRPARMGL